MAAQAEANPNVGFIGCEPFSTVLPSSNHIQQHDLLNIRIHDEDARDIIELMPDSCLRRYLALP